MASAVFPYVFLRGGFIQTLAFRNALHEQSGGRRVAQKLHAAAELVVRGRLLFPNKGGSWHDFEDFWAARFGGYEPFLYKAQGAGAAEMADALVAAAAQIDFPATRRYVDTASLVVRKGGIVQTEGVHFTLKNESGAAYVLGTSAKLVVRFGVAPGAGVAVALAYDFYYPVRFEGDELDEQDLAVGGAPVALADRTVAVQLRETGPGFSYAAVPNVL
jgi:hypothetical protein